MKGTRRTLGFYTTIGLLNAAVAVMFYTVNVRPSIPVQAAAVAIAVHQPLQPRLIPAITGTPVRIVIPSLAIDLPVGIGSYDSSSASWNVDDTKAYYADVSMPLNNSNGNTLIYGHAQTPVFARLRDIQPNSTVAVYADNGYVFHYTYQSVTNVLPTDMSVFRADGPPTLTLQTCTGDWDAYRAMYSFKLDGVEKS